MKRIVAAFAARPAEERWVIAAFAFALLLQLELVWNRPINWDEFFHLSEAHAFYHGRLTEALQVLYARAFFWLPMLPLDTVDQIRVARFFMLACELVTIGAIYGIGSRFAGRVPAALAALAYLTGGYVFQHGFSYRADPMAAAFLMGALWILTASRLDPKTLVAAGFLAGLATLTTIKVVFYLPAFAGIAWLRFRDSEDQRDTLLRLFAFSCIALVFSASLIGLTILSLPSAGTGSAAKTVSTSGTMMFSEGLFPLWLYALGAMLAAPLLAALVLLSPFGIWRAELSSPQRIALFALLLPLASIAFYRNSFPYFYAYILPPVLVSSSIAMKAAVARIPAFALTIAFVANAVVSSAGTQRDVLPRQKQVLAAAHEIFPEPVPYFDFPGMLSDFPKANFFMSTWGMRKYRSGLENTFVDALAQQTVPLLVVNKDILERNQMSQNPAWELSSDDAKALREGFIPHWGPLWVAGRRFASDERWRRFTVRTPGIHTLEGGTARIDGTLYARGETLMLTRGTHSFRRIGKGEITLRWGNHLRRPAHSFADGPLFKDF